MSNLYVYKCTRCNKVLLLEHRLAEGARTCEPMNPKCGGVLAYQGPTTSRGTT